MTTDRRSSAKMVRHGKSQMCSLASLAMILLLSLLFLGASEAGEKNDLIVYNGGVDVTSQVFISGSGDKLASFNKSDLPPAIRDGMDVEKPWKMSVRMYSIVHSGFSYTGVAISWDSPFTTAARNSLLGFYVSVEAEPPDNNRYRLYLVNHTNFEGDHLNFTFNVPYLANSVKTFKIKIYSLPPPKEAMRNEPASFQSMSVTSKYPFLITSPGRWTPSITFSASPQEGSLQNGKIDVYFELPPKLPGWNLTHFNVMLRKYSCHEVDSYTSKKIIKEVNSTDTLEHVQFNGLADDAYTIVIMVLNHMHGVDGACICKETDSRNDGSYCSISCGSTQTDWFDLNENNYPKRSDIMKNEQNGMACAPPATTIATTATTTNGLVETSDTTKGLSLDNSTASKDSNTEEISDTTKGLSLDNSTALGESRLPISEDSNTEEIIIGVTVTFVVIVILIFIFAYFYCCRRNGNEDKKDGPTLVTVSTIPERQASERNDNAKDIHRKIVYVVAVADHPESKRLLTAFCNILQIHCQCEVINPLDANLSQKSESVWVTNQMLKCDNVIFLNSRGAKELIDTYLNREEQGGVTGLTGCLDSNHSIFFKAMQIAFSSKQKRNYIIASFGEDWIGDKLACLGPKSYLLPKNMTFFLCSLHGLSEKSGEKFSFKLPLNENCHINLPEWDPLEQAAKDVNAFEKSRADWFISKYSIISNSDTPERTSCSSSSGCSSDFEKALSVSSEDLRHSAPASPDEGIVLDAGHLFYHPVGNLHGQTSDITSFTTVGQISDMGGPIPPSKPSDFDKDKFSYVLRQHNEDQCTEDDLCIVPPKNNIFEDDTSSARIADMNDGVSVWLEQSIHGINCETETDNPNCASKDGGVSKPNLLSSVSCERNEEVCLRNPEKATYKLDEHLDSGLGEMSV